MSEHTPEPWEAKNARTLQRKSIFGASHLVVHDIPEANARRIVACVNALQGADQEKLEKMEPGRLARLIEDNWP